MMRHSQRFSRPTGFRLCFRTTLITARLTTTLFLLSIFTSVLALASDEPLPSGAERYALKSTTCKAVNRAEGIEKSTIVEIRYYDVHQSSGSHDKETEIPILFVHGWPGSKLNWVRQIEHFKNDHRILVPDLRGFGQSTGPGDVSSSGTMADMASDLVCVMDNAGVERAVLVGHDWGSQVVYEAARRRPDRVEAVVGAVLPYMSAANPFTPVSTLIQMSPSLGYLAYFEKSTQHAIDELNKDVRRSLRAIYRSSENPPPETFLRSTRELLGVFGEDEIERILYLTEEEEDELVEQYSIQGFNNTLYFYAHNNKFESWKSANAQGNWTISQPALAIYVTEDPVAQWADVAEMLGSAKFLPGLSVKLMATAHWPQLEKPGEFNALLEEWLSGLRERKHRAGILGEEEGPVSSGDEPAQSPFNRPLSDEL